METQTIKKIEDSNLFWSKTYPIKYYEMDFNRELKPSALLNFMQDMATLNAEMLGFGPSFVFPRNYAWFLIKYRMDFDEYPRAIDDILIKTEPRGITKILASRDFELWTTDNKKRFGKITSQWMMIDLATKNILPLAKIVDTMPPFEKRETDLQFLKVKPPVKIDFEKTFEIRYDDIDVNQHVNNANYIIWALETIPYDFKTAHRIKTLDIIYKKEIAFGNNVLSQIELIEETKTSIHVVKNAETAEELCIINIEWA